MENVFREVGLSIPLGKNRSSASVVCCFHQAQPIQNRHLNPVRVSNRGKKSENKHEENPYHRKAFVEWKEFQRKVHEEDGGDIDEALLRQLEEEKDRWRAVLKRILDVIRFLASQNLALRGHLETQNSENRGNFLELLRLLAKYDPVIRNHLIRNRENPRSVSYMSHDIQNEFISLLAQKVRSQILEEVKQAKYFGIIIDSTPDISHVEQLSEVLRYVKLDFEKG